MTGKHSTENPQARDPQTESLLLLHGWGMNAAVWQPVVQQLESRWKVHCVNLPGHGGRHYDWCGATFNDWLQDILEQAPPRAVWLGWSLGGLFALAAAARYPRRVQRLILVATTPKFIASPDWITAGDPAVWRQFAVNLQNNPDMTNDQFLLTQSLGADKPRQLARKLKQLQQAGGAADHRALMDGLDILQTGDLRTELQQISCPVHWLLGEGDQLVPSNVCQDLVALKDSCDIHVLPDAGHALFISQTDRFLEVVCRP